jgi:aspartyl protease family protein
MPSAHVLPYGFAAILALLPGWQSGDRVPAAHTHTAAPARTPGHIIERAKDGFFYVDAAVNGTKVRFLVDTGSSAVVLSGADARRAGVSGVRDGARIDTVGGRLPVATATLDRFDLANRNLVHVDALLAPDFRHSLIGQRVLSQFETVTIRGDTMLLD